MSGLTPKQQAQEKVIKRFTGCCPFQVVAINPTKAEIEALGRSIKEEPVYTGTNKDGVATLRIDFWLKNDQMVYLDGENTINDPEPFITKASYWIENELKRSSTGSLKIINDYTQETWSVDVATVKDNPKMSWFQHEGIREGYTGEIELLKVLFKWLGFSSGNKEKGIPSDKLKLSKNISQIISTGDVSELRNAVKSCLANGNGIKFLIGVQDKNGKLYQTVYTNYPMTPSTKNYDNLNKILNDDYGQFKADYQNSFDLKLYKVKPSIVADAPVVSVVNNLF